jgi:hypothetical protein
MLRQHLSGSARLPVVHVRGRIQEDRTGREAGKEV